jgi:hypothetical protein
MFSMLAYRSTSKVEDESTCMAGLMGISISKVLEGDTSHSRMRNVYSMLPKVPLGLLFLEGPRLEETGYRWAPSSFMGLAAPSRRDTTILSKMITTRSDFGLDVKRTPGYFLDTDRVPLLDTFFILPWPRKGPRPTGDQQHTNSESLNVVCKVDYNLFKQRSRLMRKWAEIPPSDISDPAILFGADRSDLNHGSRRCVLLSDCHLRSSRWHAKFVCLMNVTALPDIGLDSATSKELEERGKERTGKVAYLQTNTLVQDWCIS